jgi:transcriptional regulator with XRE-family HTH domain
MTQAESSDMSIVGDRIKTLRESHGWSQGQLAKRAGMAPQTVMRIESGETPQPTQRTVERLARALGVPYVQLWGNLPLTAQQAPPTEYVHHALDVPLLTNVIEATRAFFDAHDLKPSPRRHAEICAYLYEHFLTHGPMEDRAFANFMQLVLQR